MDPVHRGEIPGGFVGGDQISGVSFGRDGSGDSEETTPIVCFSVDAASLGVPCTDVYSFATATSIFTSSADPFGAYSDPTDALPSWCPDVRGNCLVLGHTALGMGPHLGQGNNDDVVGVALDAFDPLGGLAFLTFEDPSFGSDSATVWVYNGLGGFEPGNNLQAYSAPADLGLQPQDVIDALAVSDVSAGGALSPNGTRDQGDDAVLFSLARLSPTLTDSHVCPSSCGRPCSAADIFRSSLAGTFTIFVRAEDLGLDASTDNVDAIDVGASRRLRGEGSCPRDTVPDFCDCNANVIADLCGIERGFSLDLQPANNRPDECEGVCIPSSPPVLEQIPETRGGPLVDLVRPRVIGVIVGDPGLAQKIRVTFLSLPPPFDGWEETVLWVSRFREVCDLPGLVDPADPLCRTPFAVAELSCDAERALAMDWSTVGTLHIVHPGIVGSTEVTPATYEVAIIHEACDPGDPSSFAAVEVTNARRSDVNGDLDSQANLWVAPDGLVGFTTDIVAIISAFGNGPGNPTKMRADVEPCRLDFLVTIADLTRVADQFSNRPFPFGPGLFDCPPDPCAATDE